MKNELSELGVYDKWLKNTEDRFNFIRLCEEDTKILLKDIQNAIDHNNVRELITTSFNWIISDEGYNYWNVLYKKIK